MELKEALQKALDGEAVLFVGAGFSTGAINLKAQEFRRSWELAKFFAERAELPPTTPLEDAAEVFADKFGEDALISEIRQEFSVQEVQEYHKKLTEIPWKRIYTTNYDNVLERAGNIEGKVLVPVTLDMDIYKIPKDHLTCVHFNGFIDKIDRETVWTTLKLTEASYLTASIADSPWAIMFRHDIRSARAVFFIGYSLYDMDIKRMLFETESLKEKCFFILGPNPDDTTQRRTSRFGTALSIGVGEFASIVQEVQQEYIPVDRSDLSTLSIKEHGVPDGDAAISDRDLLDLLRFGKRDENLILKSLTSGKKYFLERSRAEEVFNTINRGHRVIAVTSSLGNGKSLFLEGVRLRALEQGFRVFEVREHTENVTLELETIAKLSDKVLVTIEEYQGWLEDIHMFRLNAANNVTLIVTARNSIHDTFIDDLIEVSGVDYIPEIYLDTLDDQEIEWFVELFEEYGLWGKWAASSNRDKRRYLKQTCSKQIHAILLKLLDSPDIGQRIRQLSDDLRQNKEQYKVLLSIFIMTVINQMPTLDTLVDIWGAELLNSSSFRRDPIVRELIDFNRYQILVRSPIASEYLLHNIADAGVIVTVLTSMAEQVAAGARVSTRYEQLFNSLTRFSNLQLILPEEGRRGAVIRYYESIKNLHRCRSNPLFWLHYAIACLVIDELYRAETYFNTAYSLADKYNWDTFQIDNHFARFLLIQAIENLEAKDAMTNFRKARAIINRQIKKDERRHYPYKVAIHYQDFLDKFGTSLSVARVDEIAKAANIILVKIENLPEERRKHRDVRQCYKVMEYVISRSRDITAAKEGDEDNSSSEASDSS